MMRDIVTLHLYCIFFDLWGGFGFFNVSLNPETIPGNNVAQKFLPLFTYSETQAQKRLILIKFSNYVFLLSVEQ